MVIFETKWYATGCGAMSQKPQLDADLALESAKKKKKVRQRSSGRAAYLWRRSATEAQVCAPRNPIRKLELCRARTPHALCNL